MWGQEARGQKLHFFQNTVFFSYNQGVLTLRSHISFSSLAAYIRVQCTFILLSTCGSVEPDILCCLRNKSVIFNYVYLISIRPKYRNGSTDPQSFGPKSPPHPHWTWKVCSWGRLATCQSCRTPSDKIDSTKGGVHLPGADARQARSLREAVPWPYSLKRVYLVDTNPTYRTQLNLGWSWTQQSPALFQLIFLTSVLFSGPGSVGESPD